MASSSKTEEVHVNNGPMHPKWLLRLLSIPDGQPECDIHKECRNRKCNFYYQQCFVQICRNCCQDPEHSNHQRNIIQLRMSTEHITIAKDVLLGKDIKLNNVYSTIVNNCSMVFIHSHQHDRVSKIHPFSCDVCHHCFKNKISRNPNYKYCSLECMVRASAPEHLEHCAIELLKFRFNS